ncbi:MAG: tRNA (adenosine(37)-N6)-threonylcarbamoyltransferase complex dimerization subunit type 1 TsaB [Roseinatronobacter sp.]
MLSDRPLLALDTSGPYIALHLTGAGEHARFQGMPKGQGEHLHPLCTQLLAQAGCDWSDLRAIAVGTGPGNFTGIRIAVSFTRGLALGLGIPAVGVTAFEIARTGRAGRELVVLPALRGQVYVQLFGNGAALGPPEMQADVGDLAARHGADVHVTRAEASDPTRNPATRIARRARQTLEASQGVWQTRPAPLYVRPADAAPPSDPAPQILP